MNDNERDRINNSNHELVKGLEPESVFRFLADIAAVPRGSGNPGPMAEFVMEFARRRGLSSERDQTGNVIIKKTGQHTTATRGVILQAHLDMVCVKDSASDHDFSRDPIAFKLEGDWLQARGTTLGADDGIGVALALGILADAEIAHPPLEALFTVDEETDMKGAKAVKPESLRGDTLINLDAEDLNIAYISSAAGVSLKLELPLSRKPAPVAVCKKIILEGLAGGHSGIEINRQRANAYVLLARFLSAAFATGIASLLHVFEQEKGHGADNAIPDRALAMIGLDSANKGEHLVPFVEKWEMVLRNEYRCSDPGVRLRIEDADPAAAPAPLAPASREAILSLLRLIPLGVYRFSQTDELIKTPYGEILVETSCNLGIMEMKESAVVLTLLARGSTNSVLDDLLERISALTSLCGGSLKETNRTPGWEMPKSPTRVRRLFQEQGLVCKGVHAGLECGCLVEIFARAGRNLDAVAVGPDLKEVHSPKERLHTGSVLTLWRQLVAVLSSLEN